MSATPHLALADTVLAALRQALPPGRDVYGLHEPYFPGNEVQYVTECVETGWVSSAGKFVDRFEQMLAELTGLHAVAVSNGTSALQVALQLAGVQPGDEVLVPALTFVASANAVSHCHAIPHFVDSEPVTLGVDIPKLRTYLADIAQRQADGQLYNRHTGRRLAALMVMHTYGTPVDLDAAQALCQEYNIPLVEDAAEGLGSTYHGRHVGSHGLVATLSFNGNKTVTTGGGGAILSADPDLARHAKHLTTTAKTPHPWAFYHDEVAYNYRLPNLNAALGVAQLERLPEFLARKRRLAQRYAEAFAQTPGVRFFTEPTGSQSNYWLNVILLDTNSLDARDAVLSHLHQHKILARPVWNLMPDLPMYAANPSMDLAGARALERNLINLPSSVFLAN